MFTSQVAIVVCFKAFVCPSASFGRRYKGFECAFKGFERRFWDALSCYEFLAVLNVEASGQLGCLAVVNAGDAGFISWSGRWLLHYRYTNIRMADSKRSNLRMIWFHHH